MTPNGNCNCSDPDCHAPIPPAPTDHFARLEATDDVWPPTEGA